VSEELYSIGRVLLTHVGVKRAIENWCLLVRSQYVVRLRCEGDLIDVRDSELRRSTKSEIIQINLAEDASPGYLVPLLDNLIAAASATGYEQANATETRTKQTWEQVRGFIYQRAPASRGEQCLVKLGAAAQKILMTMPDIRALKLKPELIVPPPPTVEPDRGPLWGSW
jgi:hypothetical protein